jgi:tyrosine-protein phosphatase SIW14
MHKHVKRLLVGAVLIGASVTGGLAAFYGFYYIPHFAVVREGVLYRSGQPDLGDLKRLRDAYGVRTIVNLRRVDEQDGSDGPTFKEERVEAERLGMRFVHMPMDSDLPVDPKDIQRWLKIVNDKNNWPVLVHCKRGVDRTGLLAAVYRTDVQGWEPKRALDEAVAERLRPEDNPYIKAYILACRSNAAEQIATVPSPAAHGETVD